MKAAIFRLGVVLLALLADNTLGSEAEGAPGRNAAAYLLKPALVFDTTAGRTHAGWYVLVTGNHIAAVGPAAKVEAPTNAVMIQLAGMTLLPGPRGNAGRPDRRAGRPHHEHPGVAGCALGHERRRDLQTALV